jgi:hypothetical protein
MIPIDYIDVTSPTFNYKLLITVHHD